MSLVSLKEQGDYEAAYLEVPAQFQEERPTTFEELLNRIELLDAIEFTGDLSEVEKLNVIDTNNAALRTAWDAVLTLNDYAKARHDGQCQGGLKQYLDRTPSGYRTLPPGKFGENETSATMRQFGKERLFSVPVEVNPSGKVMMTAHFKLAAIGMVSPRMHVYDGHPRIPRIYIGYIGQHLTNTQTR